MEDDIGIEKTTQNRMIKRLVADGLIETKVIKSIRHFRIVT
jgi:DNA-binding MarR family transcriptional regulator